MQIYLNKLPKNQKIVLQKCKIFLNYANSIMQIE